MSLPQDPTIRASAAASRHALTRMDEMKTNLIVCACADDEICHEPHPALHVAPKGPADRHSTSMAPPTLAKENRHD
ncbi:MAG: hypothetical protein AAF088_09730 [Pseudomonadota bacterium]